MGAREAPFRVIATALREGIRSGRYAPGGIIPTEQDLAHEFQVTRETIRRAKNLLITEGLLVPGGQGIGTRVRELNQVRRDLAANIVLEYQLAVADDESSDGLFEQMTGVPAKAVRVDTAYATIEAPPRVIELLDLEPGASVLARTFTYYIQDAPHQVAVSYLPLPIATQCGLTDPAQERPGVGTLLYLHRAGIPVSRVRMWMDARMPTPEEADALAIASGWPVFENWRALLHPDENAAPVEASTSIVPADRVNYTLDLDLARLAQT